MVNRRSDWGGERKNDFFYLIIIRSGFRPRSSRQAARPSHVTRKRKIQEAAAVVIAWASKYKLLTENDVMAE